ncbi:MAG: hypothetical protein Q4B68_04925 [Bacteroidales bacterium]|nr:hypothetical protein [Bacteroidales bacterium]
MNLTKEQFQFMVEDITAELIEYLVEHENYDLKTAVDTVYGSDLFAALSNPDTGLYSQSTGYVRDYLMRELKTGKLA